MINTVNQTSGLDCKPDSLITFGLATVSLVATSVAFYVLYRQGSEIINLNRRVRGQEEEINTLQTRCTTMEKKIEVQERRCDKLEKTVVSQEKRLQKQESNTLSQERKIAQLEQRLERKENQFREKVESLSNTQRQIMTSQNEIMTRQNGLLTEVQQLKGKLESQEKLSAKFEKTIKEGETLLHRVSGKLETTNQALREVMADQEKMKEQLSHQESVIQDAQIAASHMMSGQQSLESRSFGSLPAKGPTMMRFPFGLSICQPTNTESLHNAPLFPAFPFSPPLNRTTLPSMRGSYNPNVSPIRTNSSCLDKLEYREKPYSGPESVNDKTSEENDSNFLFSMVPVLGRLIKGRRW